MEKIIVLLHVILKVKSLGLNIKHETGLRMYRLFGHLSMLLEELLKSFPYFPSPFEFSWNLVQKPCSTYVNKKRLIDHLRICYIHIPHYLVY